MKFGIGIPNCREGRDYVSGSVKPDEIAELCRMAEGLGFDSVWADDHIAPNEALRTLDSQPPSFFEPFLSLAYVAATTTKIRLGLAVLVIIWRDPVLAAKQAATLDVFSGGRLALGVGLGGSRYEFEVLNPSRPKAHRGRMLDEELEILDRLFTQDVASFKGRYYEFEGLAMYPKPLQKPLPRYFTGTGSESLRRIAHWGAGCFVAPNGEAIRQRKEALGPIMEEYGRAPSEIDIAISTTISIARTHQEAVERLQRSRVWDRFKRLPMEQVEGANFIGTPAELIDKIGNLREAGLDHCTLQRFAAPTFEEMIEQVQMFGEEVLPLFKSS